MKTVVLGHPSELPAWLERRKALGQDRHDEMWEGVYHVEKFPYYAERGVEELIIADPARRQAECWRLAGTGYTAEPGSALLGLSARTLTDQIDWP